MASILAPLFAALAFLDTQLYAEHLAGELNVVADALSRGSSLYQDHLPDIDTVLVPSKLWTTLFEHEPCPVGDLMEAAGFAPPGVILSGSSLTSTSSSATWLGILRQIRSASTSTGCFPDSQCSSVTTPRYLEQQ